MKIVGIKEINYVSKKTNRPVSGIEVYYLYKSKSINGSGVDSVYISDHVLNTLDRYPEIGDEVNILYMKNSNSVAAIDYLAK